jgi:hypothetical protein
MRICRSVWPLVFVIAGCARAPELPVERRYDPVQAEAALVTALDAWKKGEAHSLAQRNPPIRFYDDDLVAGLSLSDYEIEEPDREIEMHKDVEVILSLRDARGTVIRREARYQVATRPSLAVLRSDSR